MAVLEDDVRHLRVSGVGCRHSDSLNIVRFHAFLFSYYCLCVRLLSLRWPHLGKGTEVRIPFMVFHGINHYYLNLYRLTASSLLSYRQKVRHIHSRVVRTLAQIFGDRIPSTTIKTVSSSGGFLIFFREEFESAPLPPVKIPRHCQEGKNDFDIDH